MRARRGAVAANKRCASGSERWRDVLGFPRLVKLVVVTDCVFRYFRCLSSVIAAKHNVHPKRRGIAIGRTASGRNNRGRSVKGRRSVRAISQVPVSRMWHLSRRAVRGDDAASRRESRAGEERARIAIHTDATV